MKFEFTVTLEGEGETREEAWENALESLGADPGMSCSRSVILEDDEFDYGSDLETELDFN